VPTVAYRQSSQHGNAEAGEAIDQHVHDGPPSRFGPAVAEELAHGDTGDPGEHPAFMSCMSARSARPSPWSVLSMSRMAPARSGSPAPIAIPERVVEVSQAVLVGSGQVVAEFVENAVSDLDLETPAREELDDPLDSDSARRAGG
jgi:hypothetical protein